MTRVIKACLTLSMLLAASVAVAQNGDAERETRARALEEARRLEQQGERGQAQTAEIDVQLREAEERLAEAAARVAELSRRRLPAMAELQRHFRFGNRPMLGVTIGAEDGRGPVEGVTIRGVTPGSAAAEAGLRAGDVITAINDENLSAASDEEANRKLLDFLEGVEQGDTLEVEYLRDGNASSIEVEPRSVPGQAFAFSHDDGGFRMRHMPAPAAPGAPSAFSFVIGRGSWGDMEMVKLTSDLGRYFGTDKGLLVVRAPSNESFKLRDGDVIQSIDGREPDSVSHALRILGSYQGGETLKVEIMRDRKRETLSIEMPDDPRGFLPHGRTFAPRIELIPDPARHTVEETT